jgi:hypothetical protein
MPQHNNKRCYNNKKRGTKMLQQKNKRLYNIRRCEDVIVKDVIAKDTIVEEHDK